jgi:hypothetical protein
MWDYLVTMVSEINVDHQRHVVAQSLVSPVHLSWLSPQKCHGSLAQTGMVGILSPLYRRHYEFASTTRAKHRHGQFEGDLEVLMREAFAGELYQ